MKTGPEIILTTTWSIIHSGILNGPLSGSISVVGNAPVQLFFGDGVTNPAVSDEGPNVHDYANFRVTSSEVLWGRSLTGATVRVQPNMVESVTTPEDTALTVQNFIEYNVKHATQFEAASHISALGVGLNADTIFVVGAKPVLIKYREIQFNGTRLSFELYRAPTFSGGVAVPVYNMNDMNPQSSTVSITGEVVVTSTGTKVAPTRDFLGSDGQGNSRPAQGAALGLDRLLRPNTTYLSRLINNSASPMAISSYTSWYEGSLS